MLEIWSSMGEILVIAQFVTQFTHIPRRVVSRKQTKFCLEKTVLKIWSQESTRSTSFVPRIRQRLLTSLVWFFSFFSVFC